MRLLLVDDDRMNVDLFVAALESDGHAVTVERDGEAGRARALREPFDLVLLDLQLPRLDGYAVFRALRAAGAAVPIVALTSAALPEQIARGKAAGFDAYLTKPITPRALRDAVRRYARGPAG